MSDCLLKLGYGDARFLPNILIREQEHPTGLKLGDINVAIPHTDSKYVLKQGVAIMTLKSPVVFGRMDNPEEKIMTHIVFLLTIIDPKSYMEFLAKLTSGFLDRAFMESIYYSKTSKELLSAVKNFLQVHEGGEKQEINGSIY
jgi:PTS system galactitol-specific IIA component